MLVATDVLSEGQNLQDCAIVVNYDLPWAIIRLIQRAGRVDRIGQQAETILCYSFLPADGVERIIRLRGRVRQRLRENAEVVGTDEAFFEDDGNDGSSCATCSPRRPASSTATRRGRGGPDARTPTRSGRTRPTPTRSLAKTIRELPDVVYCHEARTTATAEQPPGVLVYMRTADGQRRARLGQRGGPERHRIAAGDPAAPPNARPTTPRYPASREAPRARAAGGRASDRRRARRRRAAGPAVAARASASTSG